ncbi:MAG: hypothetical protein AAGA48_35730 [Myxococcota bacterium]
MRLLWALTLGCAGGGVVADGAAIYDENRVDDAVTTWSEVDEAGPPSGIVLYNIGTAWLRKGDAPQAIAHLRAAGARRPRDGAVNHNLALARAELGAVPPPVGLAAGWMAVVTPGELAALGWLLILLGSGMVVAHVVRANNADPLRRSAAGVGGLGLVLAGLGIGYVAVQGATDHRRHPVAVVAVESTPLRDSPRVDAQSRSRLRLGSEVRLEQQMGDFWLVVDGKERRGWVARAAMVVPLGFRVR